MANCSDNTYYIYYTDSAGSVIAIPKSALDQETLDITLLGKTRLEYGEVFNENLLHLLEHFAVGHDVSGEGPEDEPSLDDTYANLLENPVIGQLWYNSETSDLYLCSSNDPVLWKRIDNVSSVGGSSGTLAHGETIPLPVSPDGYEFTQDECVWNIAPFYVEVNGDITSFNIAYDSGRVVTAQYTTAVDTYDGYVNYIILGIRDEDAPAQYNLEGA